MENKFNKRNRKAQLAIKKFSEYCDLHGIEYAYSGYECLDSTMDFKQIIRKCGSNTSELIRFFPDMICINNSATLVEVKSSKTIEKKAYDAYCELSNIGYNLHIVFYNNEKLFICNINELSIKRIDKYFNIPIVDNMWISPRLLPKDEYIKFKNKYNGSGTAYGMIDFDMTNFNILQ